VESVTYAYALRRLGARLSRTVLGRARWPVPSRIIKEKEGESMTIEKNREGAWVIYALGREGYLVTRSYYGYSKRESVRLFRALMREGENK
jgi:hypothetical protein